MDKFYGLKDQEKLNTDPQEVIEQHVDENVETVGEEINTVLERMEFPVKVLVFKRMQVSDEDKEKLKNNVLEKILENLDEWYGGGDEFDYPTDPDEDAIEAAAEFVDKIVNGYLVRACEPTGEVLEYDRLEVKELIG